MENKDLLVQLRQLHEAGFDYLFGSIKNPNFKEIGYFAFDPLTVEEYEKERKKEWRKLGIKQPFKKWVQENENEDYLNIVEEISILDFDMTEIFNFIDYSQLLLEGTSF